MGTLLTGGRLIDCTGAPPLPNAAVLVEGDRIADVGPRDQVAARAGSGHQVVDLRGGTLLPGLWDAHLHLGGVVPPWGAQHANESETAHACRCVQKAQENLLAGITSARTMNDRFNADLQVKAAIDSGQLVGPRLFVAGESLWTRTAAGPDEFRRKVRSALRSGIDHLKIFATSGIPYKTKVTTTLLAFDEVKAAVEEAHRWDRPVSVHAVGDEGVIMAADAGADSVEHAFVVSEAGIEAMVRNNTTFSPQLAVTAAWNERFMRAAGCFPEWMIVNAIAAGEVHHAMFAKAVKAGLKMVAGVDNLPRVPLFFGIERYEGKPAIVAELRFMIEGGLSPLQALQAVTINPAQLSRVDDRLGTIEQGKLADLIVVEGDPLANVEALHDLRLIMKGGTIVRSSLEGNPAPGFLPPVQLFEAPLALAGDSMIAGSPRPI
ncbi:MAG TPA: amidohydrolase family protein [Actinomycetes bacterium]